MKSEKKLLGVIRTELQEIADEYGDDRLTSLEKAAPASTVVVEDTPIAEEAVVAFTCGCKLSDTGGQSPVWRGRPGGL